jgi:hypothetical protein
MELASRIFDVVTSSQNIFHDTVRAIVPDEEGRRYWKDKARETSSRQFNTRAISFPAGASSSPSPVGAEVVPAC